MRGVALAPGAALGFSTIKPPAGGHFVSRYTTIDRMAITGIAGRTGSFVGSHGRAAESKQPAKGKSAGFVHLLREAAREGKIRWVRTSVEGSVAFAADEGMATLPSTEVSTPRRENPLGSYIC